MALVELIPGVSGTVCKDIFDFCDRNVEERGKPVAVLRVERLPLTAMGRIDYQALEKEYMHFDYTAWNPGE